MRATRWIPALVLALAALPASGQNNSVQAQQAEILASVGGAYVGPQAAYVQRVGERVAAAAGLGGRCTFTVVDSEVVNALTAPPGCYVYITRGLLGILNSEAELAAVLGHEVGHVAAKHAQKQQSTEALSGLAAALVGSVTKSDLAGAVAQRAAKLGALSYSRGQEYEADSLAMRFLPLAGYSARGMPDVLDDLQREDLFNARLAGRDAPQTWPVWARTHPLTTDRIRRASQQADQAALADRSGLNADTFLAALDGLPYGDDPDQGYVAGRTFIHPRLRIAFDAPQGFQLANASDGVRINGPEGMRAVFSTGRGANGLEDYANQVLKSVVGDNPVERARPVRTRINGFDTVIQPARAQTKNGTPVEVAVAAYAVNGRAFHFATVAPSGRGGVFDDMYESFRPLSDREAAGIGPQRITLVTVRRGDTAESLSAQMAGEAPLERFLMLNALQRGEPLTPGRRVKVVTGGARR